MTHKSSSTLSTTKPSLLFLFVAVLIGGYIRLSPVLRSPLPLNDGGMFYTMTRDLMANGYRLPELTSYNHLGLPYAYPPLAFYLAGGLADLTGWDLLDLFRLLPALFTVLAIPAFYLLAREMCSDEFQIIVATFVFALVPASFDWLIMGGGMTRSPAFFLALLTLYTIYRLYTRRENRYIFWTALLSALTILTHPETALHTAFSALAFFLFFGRSKSGIGKSLAVAGLTLLLTVPWWGMVLARHGSSPFLAAGQTGWHGIGAAVQLFRFDLTHEYDLSTIGTLGLIGLFWSLAEKKYFLPAWLAIIFVSEPRNAPLYVAPCVALLAALALTRILRVFDRISSKNEEEAAPFSSPWAKTAFAVLLGQWVFSCIGTTLLLVNTISLTSADQAAFRWVAANTPVDSRFLILTGNMPFSDPASEWFPALSGRESVATIQGHEWDAGSNFNHLLSESYKVQYCINQAPSCLEAWLTENQAEIDYILVRGLTSRMGEALAPIENPLPALLAADGNYEIVYQAGGITILQKSNPAQRGQHLSVMLRRFDVFKDPRNPPVGVHEKSSSQDALVLAPHELLRPPDPIGQGDLMIFVGQERKGNGVFLLELRMRPDAVGTDP